VLQPEIAGVFAFSHSLCTTPRSVSCRAADAIDASLSASKSVRHCSFGGDAVMALTALLALLYSPPVEHRSGTIQG
jgi:hypothetical protein